MMKTYRKTISMIMVLMLVFGLASGYVLTAQAAETEKEQIAFAKEEFTISEESAKDPTTSTGLNLLQKKGSEYTFMAEKAGEYTITFADDIVYKVTVYDESQATDGFSMSVGAYICIRTNQIEDDTYILASSGLVETKEGQTWRVEEPGTYLIYARWSQNDEVLYKITAAGEATRTKVTEYEVKTGVGFGFTIGGSDVDKLEYDDVFKVPEAASSIAMNQRSEDGRLLVEEAASETYTLVTYEPGEYVIKSISKNGSQRIYYVTIGYEAEYDLGNYFKMYLEPESEVEIGDGLELKSYGEAEDPVGDDQFVYDYYYVCATELGEHTITVTTPEGETVVYTIIVTERPASTPQEDDPDEDADNGDANLSAEAAMTVYTGEDFYIDVDDDDAEVTLSDGIELIGVTSGTHTEDDEEYSDGTQYCLMISETGTYKVEIKYSDGSLLTYTITAIDREETNTSVTGSVSEEFSIIVPKGSTVETDDEIKIIDVIDNEDGTETYIMIAETPGTYQITVTDPDGNVTSYTIEITEYEHDSQTDTDDGSDDTTPDDNNGNDTDTAGQEDTDGADSEDEEASDEDETEYTETETAEAAADETGEASEGTDAETADSSGSDSISTENSASSSSDNSSGDGTKDDTAYTDGTKTGEDSTLFWAIGGLGAALVCIGCLWVYRRKRLD